VSVGTPVDSSYVGTEIDLDVTYQIDKGLKYFVEAGYMFAGNYWKGATATYHPAVTGAAAFPAYWSTRKISDPWAIRHGITLSF
jgi:hypothetical protein